MKKEELFGEIIVGHVIFLIHKNNYKYAERILEELNES